MRDAVYVRTSEGMVVRVVGVRPMWWRVSGMGGRANAETGERCTKDRVLS